MKGYVSDLKQITKHNTAFRQVIETGKYMQVVVMSIPAGSEIGEEIHPDTDQVLYLIKGEGKVVMDGEKRSFKKHDMVLVRAGAKHNVINTGEEPLKILTMYAPPHHAPGTVHKTKDDAEKEEH